jgi:hypothetical protein
MLQIPPTPLIKGTLISIVPLIKGIKGDRAAKA